jgi:hypothetical protein
MSLGTNGSPRAFGGTGAAAPFVTGAIAPLWSEFHRGADRLPVRIAIRIARSPFALANLESVDRMDFPGGDAFGVGGCPRRELVTRSLEEALTRQWEKLYVRRSILM